MLNILGAGTRVSAVTAVSSASAQTVTSSVVMNTTSSMPASISGKRNVYIDCT